MALYDVYRADGSITRVEASSKAEASRKVRYAGELIKRVVEVEGATGGATTEAAIDIDLSRASIAEELPPPTGEERFGATEGPPPTTGAEYTQQQQDDYDDYLAFLQTADGKNFPTPKDISDYLTNREQWIADYDYYLRGYTEEQLREFNTWKRYASTYGDLTDWFPNNIDDWLANPDKAQKQLAIWQQEHGTALEEEEVSEAEQTEEDKYRQEQREKAAYYEQERYTEAPMYPETFTAWLNQQGQFSGALEKYVESQYPSLRSQFEAGMPRQTGFPTREGARTEAARREAGFQAWLGGEVPELEQKYWGQRPGERGERPYMQSPNIRELGW